MSKSDLTRAREMVNYFSRQYWLSYKVDGYTTVDLEILMRMLIANLDKSPLMKLKRYVTFILRDEVKTKDVLTYTNKISNSTDDDIKLYFNEVFSRFKTFKQSSYYPVMLTTNDLTGVKELDEYVNIAMYICLNMLNEEEIKKDKEKIEKSYSESLKNTNNIEENRNNSSNYIDDSSSNVAIHAATLTITTTLY